MISIDRTGVNNMKHDEIELLGKAARQKREELLNSFQKSDEPQSTEKSPLDTMLTEVSAFIEKHPLITTTTAMVVGACTERASDQIGTFGSKQFESVKDQAGRILQRTFERKVANFLEIGLAFAAGPLVQMLVTDSAHSEAAKTSTPHPQKM